MYLTETLWASVAKSQESHKEVRYRSLRGQKTKLKKMTTTTTATKTSPYCDYLDDVGTTFPNQLKHLLSRIIREANAR